MGEDVTEEHWLAVTAPQIIFDLLKYWSLNDVARWKARYR